MAAWTLRHPYPTVEKGGEIAQGGSQHWLKEPVARKYGCGVVAAASLLLYLHRWGEGWDSDYFKSLPDRDPIPWEIYDFYADRLRKRYFPLVPPFGLNAWLLAGGLNRYFRANKIPLRAGWGTAPGTLWQTAEEMLRRDIPVILCIGPNFPFPWQNRQLPLYARQRNGGPAGCGSVKAHYVTILGMEEEWVTITSWGRIYQIRRSEFDRYRREASCALYSGIVRIR